MEIRKRQLVVIGVTNGFEVRLHAADPDFERTKEVFVFESFSGLMKHLEKEFAEDPYDPSELG